MIKTMKTLLKTGYLMILGTFLTCLFSCEDPENPFDPNVREKISVTGQVHANDVSFVVNDRSATDALESFMNGNGIISGDGIMFADGELKLSSRQTHVTYKESLDNVQIESGQFEYVFDNGDMIFGTYSGCGIFTDCENVCCNLRLQISGGTGIYSRAMGGLEVVMNPDGNQNSNGLSLDLTGSIYVIKEAD